MTQAERRGAALRAQADAALDFKYETGQAQDASAYVGGSHLACPALLSKSLSSCWSVLSYRRAKQAGSKVYAALVA